MVRQLELKAPTGLTLTCELVSRGTNVVTETISLTEKSVAKQIYTGTIATASGATYEINIKSGSNYIGVDEIYIAATDGVTYRASVGEAVWNYSPRTLTTSTGSGGSSVSGSNVTVYRGTKWSIALTNIGALTGWTKLYFTARTLEEQAEAQSQVQIKLTNPSAGTDGLLYLNGSSTVTASHGSITVDDEPTGDITISLAAAASTSTVPGVYYYDVKMITASNVTILTIGGILTIAPDITRAVS